MSLKMHGCDVEIMSVLCAVKTLDEAVGVLSAVSIMTVKLGEV